MGTFTRNTRTRNTSKSIIFQFNEQKFLGYKSKPSLLPSTSLPITLLDCLIMYVVSLYTSLCTADYKVK